MNNKFLSSVAAVALLTTGLMAQSQLDITAKANASDSTAVDADIAGTTSGAVTIAKEVLTGATQDIDFDTITNARTLIYKPDINLAQSSTIEITMTNGAVKATTGNNLYMTDNNGEVGKMTDFTTDANGNYTWMRFQITAAAGMVSQKTAHFTETNAAGSNDEITVVANQGLAKGAKVTAQVTLAKDDNGNLQNAPKTAPEALAEVVDGITAAVATPITTSTIDVNADRKKFTGNSTTSTSTTVSVATSAAEVGLALNAAGDKYKLTIERDNCSGLDDVPGSITLASGTAPADFNTTAACKWEWTGDFTDATGGALAGAGDTATITVNGNDVLQTGDWKVSLEVEADEVTPAGTKLNVLDKETLIKWDINGAQFVIPYLNTEANYGTYLVVTNTSDQTASISMDVYADKGQQYGQAQSGMACQNVALGTLPANSTVTYYPDDFNTAIDGTSGCANFTAENNRFMGQFSVIAPDNAIHAVAFQKDGANGKRSIPVLTTAGHSWKE